jgi:uncharacterized protein involved in exopolysaccharide biosynthesis
VKWIALAALIGLIVGMAYAKLAKPRYTVTTDILIDPSGLHRFIFTGAIFTGRKPARPMLDRCR